MKETTTRSIQEIINDTYKKYNITLKSREELYRDCGTLISVDDYCTEYTDCHSITEKDQNDKPYSYRLSMSQSTDFCITSCSNY